MSDKETSAILGLKRELKTTRDKARAAQDEAGRWRRIANTLRGIAGLDDGQFGNLIRSEGLSAE
ncbi:hypothetical protein [Bradyrhizobium sp. 149]|uniref:hypothetical protein n=1 Tax=Bradyrhizobium sp. 149 TaxID=2782624 RepID=UPI001FFB6B7B|nr:hypothetical protein [Bradyrhizobium sp. 149]